MVYGYILAAILPALWVFLWIWCGQISDKLGGTQYSATPFSAILTMTVSFLMTVGASVYIQITLASINPIIE